MTNNLWRYSIRNFIHSAVLIGSMLFLAAILGWMMWGIIGVIWTTLFSLFFLLVAPSVSPQLLLKIYGARPISEYEAPNLIQILRELAKKAQLPTMPQLYYMPSKMANSFAIGSSDKAAIAVTDGLLHKLTLRELRGVLSSRGRPSAQERWMGHEFGRFGEPYGQRHVLDGPNTPIHQSTSVVDRRLSRSMVPYNPPNDGAHSKRFIAAGFVTCPRI